MSFHIDTGFAPETYGWQESGNDGDVEGFLSTRVAAIYETWRRGDSVLRISWSSPVTITDWSLNGKTGADNLNDFMKAIK